MSVFRCPECGFTYDEERGDAREGFAPGTPLADLPDDWHCPECGVEHRDDFLPAAAAR